MERPLTGGCNCGAVRYEVTEPLVRASYCHCRRCQRRTGTAASASAHPAPRAFRIVAGEEQLRMWQPPDGGEKWFCGVCGSSIFGRNPSHPESVGIRMGTFDEDPGVRPTVRQFVAYAAAWEPLPDDELPRFSESRHAPGARPIWLPELRFAILERALDFRVARTAPGTARCRSNRLHRPSDLASPCGFAAPGAGRRGRRHSSTS